MTCTVGIRALKSHLGRYLRLAREGRRVIVTDRGRPVAEIRPIGPAADDEAAILRDLAALGKITLGSGEPFRPLRALRLKGASLSRAIIEDREDRV